MKEKAGKERVAVIAPCPFFIDRGTPIRIKRLASALAEDFSIHLITFHQGNNGPFPFKIHRTFPLPLRIKRSGANLAKLFYDLLLLFTTIRVVRREGIRVIDGHLHEGAFIGLLAKTFTGARVIYNAHGTFVQELLATGALKQDSWLIPPLARFEQWVEQRADCLVAQSRLRKDEFVGRGVPAEKIVVVEDVPELDLFAPHNVPVEPGLEKRLRPHGEKLLIYSGGMETYQGVDFLLAAFRTICGLRTDVRLILFGRPLAEYRRMTADLGMAERIEFIDNEPFERLPAYLRICDIGFALRLYGENVPGKLPIYMASGIPVVGTDTKGINSVITHGETGILVPPEDVPALVRTVTDLLDDTERARRIGAAGREEALRRYSPDDVKRELGRVYRALLNSEKKEEKK